MITLVSNYNFFDIRFRFNARLLERDDLAASSARFKVWQRTAVRARVANFIFILTI